MSEINENLSEAEQKQFEALKAKAEGRQNLAPAPAEKSAIVDTAQVNSFDIGTNDKPEVPKGPNDSPLHPPSPSAPAETGPIANSEMKELLTGVLRGEVPIDQINMEKTDPHDLTEEMKNRAT